MIINNLLDEWHCIQSKMSDHISTYFDMSQFVLIAACSKKNSSNPFSATMIVKDCDFSEENSLIVEKIVRDKVEKNNIVKPSAVNNLMAFLNPDLEDEEIIEKSDMSMEIDESMDVSEDNDLNESQNDRSEINLENLPSSLLKLFHSKESCELLMSFFVLFNGTYFLSLIKFNESNQKYCAFIKLPICNFLPFSFEFFNEGEIGLLYPIEGNNKKCQFSVVSIEDVCFFVFNIILYVGRIL